MDFIPYKVNEVLENVFYQIPKELFTNPAYNNLDSNSILLYGLLLDRLSVSMKNKWIDKEGNIYLIYSRKEAQKMLKLSDKPVSKAFKKLEEAKLIYEIRSGFKKNNIIYVGKINHISTEKTMNRRMYDVVIINIIKIIIVRKAILQKILLVILNKEFIPQKTLKNYMQILIGIIYMKIKNWRKSKMNNTITYHKEGDYLIPDLYLPKQSKKNIGKYGRLKLNYIKNFKKGLYTELMLKGTLNEYLFEINDTATKRINELIKQLALNENVDEKLKEHHQMEWVQSMNSIKNRAEEIVLNEIIYV